MRKCAVLIAVTGMSLTPIHGGSLSAAPPSGGTVSIEPRTADGDYDASMHSFLEATAEALAARGFTILADPGHAAYVAELILSRGEVGTGLTKAASEHAAVAPGGDFTAVGAGLTIPFSTGQSRLVALERTKLELRLRKRDDKRVIWDGAAVTVRAAGTRKGSAGTVASNLSEAVLQNYPAEPEGVVGVP